jgi:hypothetical protein
MIQALSCRAVAAYTAKGAGDPNPMRRCFLGNHSVGGEKGLCLRLPNYHMVGFFGPGHDIISKRERVVKWFFNEFSGNSGGN